MASDAKECCPDCGSSLRNKHKEHGRMKWLWECGSFRYDQGGIVVASTCTRRRLSKAVDAFYEENKTLRSQLAAAEERVKELERVADRSRKWLVWLTSHLKWKEFCRVRGCLDEQIDELAELIGEGESSTT